jgi:hypothetical protein
MQKQGGNKNKSRQVEALDNKSIKMPSKVLNGKKKAITIAHASSDDEDDDEETGVEKSSDSVKVLYIFYTIQSS